MQIVEVEKLVSVVVSNSLKLKPNFMEIGVTDVTVSELQITIYVDLLKEQQKLKALDVMKVNYDSI